MSDDPDYCADVAYQGAPGAFSEDAAWALAGREARLLPCRTLGDVASALRCRRAASAVVPLWNSIAGDVPGAMTFVTSAAFIPIGALTLPIVQCLVARPGADLAGIVEVRSHPVALAQCERFFAAHPWLRQSPDFDTAGSVAAVARGRGRGPGQAAIASARAACLWGLSVLADGIQDTADNRTRFIHVMS